MNAMHLIVIFGLVSLFADVTYEGGRSAIGPFLSFLGANGLVIGLISGAGEFAGYGLRLLSGSIADWTRRYWLMTFAGYIISLAAIPLLALTNRWEWAAVLIIAERVGKAIRSPARDTLLSFATKKIGRGWGFGIHEALDQVGALIGPLFVLAILLAHGSYQFSFALLAIPAVFALSWLIAARIRFPAPQRMEPESVQSNGGSFPAVFWFYVAGVSMVSFGFINYSLIGFHLIGHLPSFWIPLLYAIAMPVSSISALWLGRLFDRFGIIVIIAATALSAFFAPLVLSPGLIGPILGMALWGVGLGSQESIMRAAVARWIRPEKRGQAYGILNFGVGMFWFAGSAAAGWLLDRSLWGAALFSLSAELAAIPIFFKVLRYEKSH